MYKQLLILSALLATIRTSTWTYQAQNLWQNDNAICGSGAEQSPINFIRTGINEVLGFVDLKTDYWGKAGLKTKNTGHGLQVDGEWGTLVYSGVTYYIKQFHFHQPSEHTFDLMQ
jgi:carbonic anhydrase